MDQQNQQPTQKETESKSSIKTNWEFLIIILLLAFLVIAGILIWEPAVKQGIVPLQEIVHESAVRLMCIPANSPEARAEQLAMAKSILEIDTKDSKFMLSPNGRYLAARAVSGKERFVDNGWIHIYDVSINPPRKINIPNVGQISAAFSKDSKTVWLGTVKGEAAQFNLQTEKIEKSITIMLNHEIDEIVISSDGKYIGWYTKTKEILNKWPPPPEWKGDGAGVFDLDTNQNLKIWERAGYYGVGPGTPTRNIYFAPDKPQRFIAFTEKGLVVWNAQVDTTQWIHGVYPMDSSPGYAYVDGKVYYSGGGSDITIADVGFRDPFGSKAVDESGTLEPNLQGGHFVDMFSSPSDRLLAVQSHLGGDARPHLYDLNAKKRINVIGKENENGFLGWDRPLELVFTAGENIVLWNPQGGENLGAIPIPVGWRPTKVEVSADGCFFVASGWMSQGEGKPVRHRITIFEIPAVEREKNAESTVDTSTWQTYRNEEFGFEVKVPSSFQDFGGGEFLNNDIGSWAVSVKETEKSLQDYVDERVAPENNIFEGNVILTVKERKDIQIDGREGIYLDTYVGNGLAAPVLQTYIATFGNDIIHIRMIWFDGKASEEVAKNSYDQILSTFRFVE